MAFLGNSSWSLPGGSGFPALASVLKSRKATRGAGAGVVCVLIVSGMAACAATGKSVGVARPDGFPTSVSYSYGDSIDGAPAIFNAPRGM